MGRGVGIFFIIVCGGGVELSIVFAGRGVVIVYTSSSLVGVWSRPSSMLVECWDCVHHRLWWGVEMSIIFAGRGVGIVYIIVTGGGVRLLSIFWGCCLWWGVEMSIIFAGRGVGIVYIIVSGGGVEMSIIFAGGGGGDCLHHRL